MRANFTYQLSLASLDRLPSADELRRLSRDEQARAAAFAFERDRRRYLAAHVALRTTLASYLGVAPESLRMQTNRFGKPSLASPAASCAFSLSHSEDVAAIAVAREGHIGVDVEVLREVSDAAALARRHFSTSEQAQLRELAGSARDEAFLTCWTRKEACLKAIGCGVSLAPGSFEAGASAGRDRVIVPCERGSVELLVESRTERGAKVVSVAWVVADPSGSCA